MVTKRTIANCYKYNVTLLYCIDSFITVETLYLYVNVYEEFVSLISLDAVMVDLDCSTV